MALSPAQVLAAAGTTSSSLVMLGGLLTSKYPKVGPKLVGLAGAVMLVGNLLVLFVV